MEKSAWKFLFKAVLWIGQILLGFTLILFIGMILSGNWEDMGIESAAQLINFIPVFIYISMYFVVIRMLILIIRSSEESPFIIENVKRFNLMGICMLINSILECLLGYTSGRDSGIIQIIATPNGAITPTMVVCIISSLMCFVMSGVFKRAIEIKDENDLTI